MPASATLPAALSSVGDAALWYMNAMPYEELGECLGAAVPSHPAVGRVPGLPRAYSCRRDETDQRLQQTC